jgi:hypothetical protein
MNSLVNFILNTLAISIPEEFFITYIILFFLKIFRITNHQYLDIHDNFKKNILQVFIKSVLPIAVISNLLLFFKVDASLVSMICLIMFPLSIICLLSNKIKSYKYILIFIVSLICLSLEAALQTICYKTLFTITITDFNYFFSSENKKIVLTLLPHFIEYIFLIVAFIKSNLVIKTNIIQEFYRNKILLTFVLVFIMLNSIMFISLFKNIVDSNILNTLQYSKWMQVIITVIIFLWLCLIIFAIWFIPTIIQMNEKYRSKYGRRLNS